MTKRTPKEIQRYIRSLERAVASFAKRRRISVRKLHNAVGRSIESDPHHPLRTTIDREQIALIARQMRRKPTPRTDTMHHDGDAVKADSRRAGVAPTSPKTSGTYAGTTSFRHDAPHDAPPARVTDEIIGRLQTIKDRLDSSNKFGYETIERLGAPYVGPGDPEKSARDIEGSGQLATIRALLGGIESGLTYLEDINNRFNGL